MVGLAQGGHHLPLDEVLAAEAASPVQSLVVQSTDVFTLTHEEASLGQFTSTYCDEKGREGGQKGTGKRMGKEKDGKEGVQKSETALTKSITFKSKN